MEVVAALLIYGGTAGGFTAALEAASLGVDVVLVEEGVQGVVVSDLHVRPDGVLALRR